METTIQISTVLNAVKKAGNLFLTQYKTNPIPLDKADLLRQLDSIDEACIRLLKTELNPVYPGIPYAGNEFNYDEQNGPLDLPEYWLCDSMDGAIQYLQHLPGWTINLVLIRNAKPVLSVIFDPLADEIFYAEEGKGAFMNGKAIKPSTKKDTSAMIAVFEYGHQAKSNEKLFENTGKAVTALLGGFGVVRNYGPHGLQLAYVGCGRIDMFYQEGQDAYNWLAGTLIAKEAGADLLTTDGCSWKWGEASLLVSSPNTGKNFVINRKQ